MISRLALSTLVTLASLVSVSAGDLSLKVNGPAQVDDISDLRIKATLKNTGGSVLMLVNDPRSVLSTHPTDTFVIAHESGANPTFTGMLVRYSLDFTVEKGAVTTLNPGQSVDVTQSLADAYNFTNSGPGSYEISPSTLFHAVSETGKPQPIYASLENSHTVAISGSGRLAVPRQLRVSRRQEAPPADSPSFESCTEDQQSQIRDAIPAAVTYVDEALSYLNSHKSSSRRFRTWFGRFTHAHRKTALGYFSNLATTPGMFTQYTYDCNCQVPDWFAYVYPDEYPLVHLCPLFWGQPTKGANSKAATLVHEGTHFAGAGDYAAVGADASQRLARDKPNEAIQNAESLMYFATNDPPLP